MENRKDNRDGVVRDEIVHIVALVHITVDHILSTRPLAVVSGASRSINKILNVHKFYQYKIKLFHERNGDDYVRKL